ncbi:phage tail tape measure protein [Gemella sanguinis]|uniref:phage tail tape measure protein n=1 Tax=Gemella sanguinis TaxID=84135 RepID=UPI00352F13F3
MSGYMDKVGVILTAEGVGSFTSALKQGENALRQLQAEARRNIASLGSGGKAYDVYKAKMNGLSSQMKQSASNVNLLKSKYDALKQSTSQLPKEIDKLTGSLKQKQSTLKTTGTLLESQKEHLKHLQKTYGKTSEAALKYKDTVANTSKAYKNTEKEVKALETQIKSLNGTFSSQQRELQSLPTKIANAETGYFKLRDAMQQTHTAFRNNGGKLADVAQRFNDVGGRVQAFGQKMSGFGDGLSKMTAGLSTGMYLAGKAAIDFESSFAGVVKTVNGSPEQLNRIRQGFLDLSTQIPVSANELAKIGEVAGQLGIKTENILDFTKTIADLGATTNLSAEEGATSLAQFMAVMGTSQGNIRNLGSSIVELGNNFATNERSIVEMAQRLSGMGKQTNMAEADVLGLAAALSTVGIEAEAGGSAMTQVMNKMQNAVASGGDGLQKFASAAGVSANEFANAFRTRPVEALQMLLKGLDEVKENGGNVNEVLAGLGITGIREADAIKRLAGALNGDSGLGKALDIANKGWKENNALTKEASIRYQTSASKLKMAKNEIQKMAIEMGSQLLPKLAQALTASKPLVNSLGNMMLWFSKLPTAVQLATLGFGPFMSVLGRMTTGIGSGVKAIGSFVKWVGKMSTAKSVGDMIKLSTSIAGVGTQAAKAGSMATLLTNPYVAGAALIGAAFVGVGTAIYREMTKHSRNHEAAIELTNGKYKEWYDAVIKGAEQSGNSINHMGDAVKRNSEAVKSEIKRVQAANTEIMENINKNFQEGKWYKFQFDGRFRKQLKEALSLSDEDVNQISSNVQVAANLVGNSLASLNDTYLKGKIVTSDYAMAQIKAATDITAATVQSVEQRKAAELSALEQKKANNLLTEELYNQQKDQISQHYDSIVKETQNAQNTINDILSSAARENRILTGSELEQLREAYQKIGKTATEAATESKEAQKILQEAFDDTAATAQLAAYKQMGIIDQAKETYIKGLGSAEKKVQELNKALDEWAAKDGGIKSIGIEFEGGDIAFNFKNDYERLLAMPDIVKAVRISENEGRTIKMTIDDLNFLNSMGIHPKNVQIIDQASQPLDNVNGKIGQFKDTEIAPKSIMLRDEATPNITKAFNKLLDFASLNVPDKNINATDNASAVIDQAKFSLDGFNATETPVKSIMAQGNATPFTDQATSSLNTFNATDTPTKSIMAQGNATPFTNQATSSLNAFNGTPTPPKVLSAVDAASGTIYGVIGLLNSIPREVVSVIRTVSMVSGLPGLPFATGGHIPMFARGGNIGQTENLQPSFTGIVGEAGPELFRVTKHGVNITPLSTSEKIKGISGALAEQGARNGGSNEINVTINVTGNNINNKEDINVLVDTIEQKLVRKMKEVKSMSFGGGRNAVTL